MHKSLNFDGQASATLDLRYRGQSHEIAVPLQILPSGLETAGRAFHDAHQTRFGYAHFEREIEVVTLRLHLLQRGLEWEMPSEAAGETRASPVSSKMVWLENGPQHVPCFERETLRAGQSFAGPALVWQFDATTLVGQKWRARLDERRNLWLETAVA